MLAYKSVSGTKSFKKLVHLSLQFVALCLSIVGIWAALKFHNDKGIDNFYSLHSWLGLACLFLFSLQVTTSSWHSNLYPSHHFLNLTINLLYQCSGQLHLPSSGTQVGRKTAEPHYFHGTYFLGFTCMHLLLPLPPLVSLKKQHSFRQTM